MTMGVFDNCILHEWILRETTASSALYFPPMFDNRELSECVCRGVGVGGWGGTAQLPVETPPSPVVTVQQNCVKGCN